MSETLSTLYTNMSVVDDYLNQVAVPQRAELERIRGIIRQQVPEAVEVITYGMPGFKYRGKYLISFAVFKDHLSLFPGTHPIEALKSQLQAYPLSKGTIRFNLDNPLSEELIKQIVQVQTTDIEKG